MILAQKNTNPDLNCLGKQLSRTRNILELVLNARDRSAGRSNWLLTRSVIIT